LNNQRKDLVDDDKQKLQARLPELKTGTTGTLT